MEVKLRVWRQSPPRQPGKGQLSAAPASWHFPSAPSSRCEAPHQTHLLLVAQGSHPEASERRAEKELWIADFYSGIMTENRTCFGALSPASGQSGAARVGGLSGLKITGHKSAEITWSTPLICTGGA